MATKKVVGIILRLSQVVAGTFVALVIASLSSHGQDIPYKTVGPLPVETGGGGATLHSFRAMPSAPAGIQEDTPAPTVSFQGLADNNGPYPPDVHGAVGPSHVVTMLNTEMRVQNRSGTTNLKHEDSGTVLAAQHQYQLL